MKEIEERNSLQALQEKSKDLCKWCGVSLTSDNYDFQNSRYYELRCNDCLKKMNEENEKKAIDSSILRNIPSKFINIETDKVDLLSELEDKNIFINGGTGAGKTVFACSVGKHHLRNKKSIEFISFPKFIMKLQSLFKSEEKGEFGRIETPYSYAESIANFGGLLILDDLGAEKITDFVRQITYFIINEREMQMKQTIITSNFSVDKIDHMIDPRISSRIAGGYEVLDFGNKDRRLS